MHWLKKKKVQNNCFTALFLAVPLICYCFSTVIPFIGGNTYAFMDWNGISAEKSFIGFANYAKVFQDNRFWSTMWFSFRYSLVSVLCVNTFALLLALMLNTEIRNRNFLRLLLFLPQLIGSLLVGYVWKFVLGTIIPYIGEVTGIPIFQVNWLGRRSLAFASLVMVSTWQGMGYYMLIYLAALQGVSRDLLEAATIDGAGILRRFWNITLPMIRHSFTICIFLSALNGMRLYDHILVLTDGGPVRSTESVVWNIYREGFNSYKYGYGSAKSVIFFIILVLFGIIQISLMRRREVEA